MVFRVSTYIRKEEDKMSI